MGARRFELRTSPLSGVRSSQLSYAPCRPRPSHSKPIRPRVNRLPEPMAPGQDRSESSDPRSARAQSTGAAIGPVSIYCPRMDLNDPFGPFPNIRPDVLGFEDFDLVAKTDDPGQNLVERLDLEKQV